MKKKISILYIMFVFSLTTYAQKDTMLIRLHSSAISHDSIMLVITNTDQQSNFFYTIGIQGLADSGWVGLVADINSLGKNDFVALKLIKPTQKITAYVSRRRINKFFGRQNFKRLRFSLFYCNKRDFSSNCKTIYFSEKY